MPDTNRTKAALQALLADNVAGDISAADVRDFLESVFTLGTKGDLAGIDAAGLRQALPVSGNDGWVFTEDAASTLGWKWAVAGAGGSVATDAIWDAKGDLAVGTGANTAAKLTVGANDTIPMADSGETTGIKWVASGTPSTQAFGDAAAVGTADTFTRGDHKHAMPADPTTGKFTKVVVARWYIDGRLRADASNAQGGVWPIPDYANAGVLVEGEAIFGALGTVSAGAAVTFDIKHATTYEGSRTTIFSSTPSIAIGDSFTGDGSSNDGTIDTSPDYTILDGGFFWLYITAVGSTAGSEGQDLTVTVTGRVKIE